MLRRLAPIIIIFSLIISPFIFATPVKAAGLDDISGDKTTEKYLQDFCAKRKGNQMNLETWYSGKCTDDTFSGEGVGFSDIIILDLAEKLSGKKDPNETFTQTIEKVISKFGKTSMNASPEEKQIALNSARDELFSSQKNSVVNGVGNMMASVFQIQPASTYTYLAYVSQNLQKHKIIPEALAASPNGTGFETFRAFLPVWTAMRNIAYLGLVLFFIIYGFMMMFRVNLGQKTVITVQLAIPKLIVTLLIITFSYAIVGLLIDFMWVMVYLALNLLRSQQLIFQTDIPILKEWYPAKVASGEQYGIFGSFFLNTLVSIPAAIYGAAKLIIGGSGWVSNAATLGLIAFGGGISLILGIIVIFAVIISYIKLLGKLISAFISIVISLITAPLALLGNAFPGSSAIGNWIRGLVANISVFPITMILLLFSYMLMVQPFFELCTATPLFSSSTCEAVFGVKNLTGDSSEMKMPLMNPMFGSFSSDGLLALLGVGLLLMSAKYVDMVRDALKAPAFKYGTAIGDALKYGIGVNDKLASKGYSGVPGGGAASKVYGPSGPGEKPTFFHTPNGADVTSVTKEMGL